ncbi:hypothetical protein OQA88_11237 [Cercophora sp. LCS_1]
MRLGRQPRKTDDGVLSTKTTLLLPGSNASSQLPSRRGTKQYGGLKKLLRVRPNPPVQTLIDEKYGSHGEATASLELKASSLQLGQPLWLDAGHRGEASETDRAVSALGAQHGDDDHGYEGFFDPPPLPLHSTPSKPPPQPLAAAFQNETETLFLACPFWKSNPQTYHACSLIKITRFKDMKQHLKRKHGNAIFHCGRCFEIFGSVEALKTHQLGVQRCNLRQSQSRGKSSTEKKWVSLWHNLFPGMNPPKTPYVDNSSDESLHRLRAFWLANGAEITSETLEWAEPVPPEQLEGAVQLFDKFIDRLLGRFETSPAVFSVTPSQSIDATKGESLTTRSTAMGDYHPRKELPTYNPYPGYPVSSTNMMMGDFTMPPQLSIPLSCPSEIPFVSMSDFNYLSTQSVSSFDRNHERCLSSEFEYPYEVDLMGYTNPASRQSIR